MAKLAVIGSVLVNPVFADEGEAGISRLEQGKELAFSRTKGNCLACHYVEGGELTGNYGPPLIAMKVRFPDREVLRAQIGMQRSRILTPGCRLLAGTGY